MRHWFAMGIGKDHSGLFEDCQCIGDTVLMDQHHCRVTGFQLIIRAGDAYEIFADHCSD